MAIMHLRLGKITKRSDGRFQAGYRDVDGTRKFITCRTEEEVRSRFQALLPTVTYNAAACSEGCDAGSIHRRGQPMADGGEAPPPETTIPHSVLSDERMLLANYALNWLETYKKGKIRPSSYERYQFCLQLLCKDELAHMDVRAIRLEDIQMYVNRLGDMSVHH